MSLQRSWVTWPGGPNLILSWAKTSAATFTHPMIWKLACAGHPQFQWTKTSWIPYSNGHNWALPLVTQSHRLGSSIRLVWEYLRKIYEKRSEKPQIRVIQVLVLTGQSTVERLSTASQTSAGDPRSVGQPMRYHQTFGKWMQKRPIIRWLWNWCLDMCPFYPYVHADTYM